MTKLLGRNLRSQGSALDLLCDQNPLALFAIIANATVYTFFSWNLVPAKQLHIWLGVIFAIVASRVYWQALWRGFRSRTAREIKAAYRWLTGLANLSALAWGFGMTVMLNTSSMEHFLLTVCIIAGVGAGAAGAYSASLRIALPYIGLLILPLTIRLMAIGKQPFTTVGWLSLLYCILLSLIVVNTHRLMRRSIEIGLDNEDLVHRLGEASHEIRTPVTAISGFAEILASMEDSAPQAKQYACAIRRNCIYLRGLLDNVLSMSRAELGATAEDLEVVNIRDLVGQSLEMVRSAAERKGLYLKLDVALSVPECARLQPVNTQQILVNLLTNAVKFTCKGGVDVGVRLSRGVELIFQVCDTGVGISSANQEAVFRPFWREKRTEKTEEGAGLGLSLARTLAIKMGGELSLLKSECGSGSTFELRVPLVV